MRFPLEIIEKFYILWVIVFPTSKSWRMGRLFDGTVFTDKEVER